MSMSTPRRRLLATMAAHLPAPRLPVHLLFVFLAVHVHVPASHAAPPPPLPSSYDSSICSESVMCGTVNISYPFYLFDPAREIADYSCGYTDLKIFCQRKRLPETPVITLGGADYAVQNISYDTYTIVLADIEVLAGGSCPAVSHNVSFDELWLHNPITSHSLTFFFGCHLRGPLTPGFDAYKYKIKCSGFNGPPGDSLVLITDELDWYLEEELAMNCSMIVTVPVRGDALMAASNQSNFTWDGYGYVLKGGFELEWSRRITTEADRCQQCEESAGRCAYGTDREFMGCLCDGRKVGSPDCKHIVRAASSKS